MKKISPARSSYIVPSFIAAVAAPEITTPTCSTWQLLAPVAPPACVDHFQPGSYVARPSVIPLMRTISNLPFSNVRISSGESNRFRITSSIASAPLPPFRAASVVRWMSLPPKKMRRPPPIRRSKPDFLCASVRLRIQSYTAFVVWRWRRAFVTMGLRCLPSAKLEEKREGETPREIEVQGLGRLLSSSTNYPPAFCSECNSQSPPEALRTLPNPAACSRAQ